MLELNQKNGMSGSESRIRTPLSRTIGMKQLQLRLLIQSKFLNSYNGGSYSVHIRPEKNENTEIY